MVDPQDESAHISQNVPMKVPLKCAYEIRCAWRFFVTLLSPIVGGHLTFEQVTSPSQKRSLWITWCKKNVSKNLANPHHPWPSKNKKKHLNSTPTSPTFARGADDHLRKKKKRQRRLVFSDDRVGNHCSWKTRKFEGKKGLSMVVSGSLKGGIGSIWAPPEGKDYKWSISGIYCQLGDYMLPTTFYGNQKQPLSLNNCVPKTQMTFGCFCLKLGLVLEGFFPSLQK